MQFLKKGDDVDAVAQRLREQGCHVRNQSLAPGERMYIILAGVGYALVREADPLPSDGSLLEQPSREDFLSAIGMRPSSTTRTNPKKPR